MQSLPQVDSIFAKMEQLKSHLHVVGTERAHTTKSLGRVLAQDVCAFRDSPSTDVSAMDGYAVRLSDISDQPLLVTGTATAGSPPLQLTPDSAVRVFTGGPVPPQAECVIRREDCIESPSHVAFRVPNGSIAIGQNIRRKGENAKAGQVVIKKGNSLTPGRFAGALTFLNEPSVEVFQQVRVSIINTGDELIDFGNHVEPWQIRDSNGPFLESSLASYPWLLTVRSKVPDQRDKTEHAISERLAECDVLLLTGGVSMGDTDYVPDSIRAVGGHVEFHRIPIRPGRPMLGAYGPRGQLILGLPGNPLSVAVTFRRFAMDLIRHVAGFSNAEPVPSLLLASDDPKTIDLTWFRLASLNDAGALTLVATQGSGDIASLLHSDGFAEIPPNSPAAGTRKFYAW